MRQIADVQMNGQELELGGSLDIGILVIMANLPVSLVDAAAFSIGGFLHVGSRVRIQNAAPDFASRKLPADNDYLTMEQERTLTAGGRKPDEPGSGRRRNNGTDASTRHSDCPDAFHLEANPDSAVR